MDCEFSKQLGPYVDGELGAARATQVEAHLLGCPMCARELRELRGLRAVFAATQFPSLSAAGMARVRQRAAALAEAPDQRLLRIARLLSGVAACLLIAGTLRLSTAGGQPVKAASWERRALMIPTAAPADPSDVANPEWVLADLSGKHGDE
jgi:anti-sigma factor RsiW